MEYYVNAVIFFVSLRQYLAILTAFEFKQ